MLTLALQKKGRLSDTSLRLLQDCGIKISAPRNGTLRARAVNFPMEVLFLRDDDIPECIADGAADCGIVGENVIAEKKKRLSVELPLGFGRCRLSIALPREKNYEGRASLSGLRIATSYPVILQDFLERHNISAAIHEISGSVEISPGIGLADAIFDIVSTGSTLLSNGLREVEQVMTSQAVLAAQLQLSADKREKLNQLLFRIKAVQRAANNKYILLNAPNTALEDVARLLPGMNSPSVVPLAREGWSSLHSVINEDDFWENIDKLKKLGAEGILIIPIEKMIL
ncbi:MAG: ATP phosphoribosyltransferase [Calditrichaeota bacterium]|nr:MAG: ATP phosphoribosyltransferase [Calditrichota bacterium]